MTESERADYRLPTAVVPVRYDIRLEPDLDNATFAGSVLCSQISIALTPGTYYLRVRASTSITAGTNVGQFRISVRDTP